MKKIVDTSNFLRSKLCRLSLLKAKVTYVILFYDPRLENVMASEVIEANLTYEYHSFIHVLPFRHEYISM